MSFQPILDVEVLQLDYYLIYRVVLDVHLGILGSLREYMLHYLNDIR